MYFLSVTCGNLPFGAGMAFSFAYKKKTVGAPVQIIILVE